MSEQRLSKAEWQEDPVSRLETLADQFEPRMRARFLELVATVKDQLTLERIEQLLVMGRYDDALYGLEQISLGMAAEWNRAFVLSGSSTADFLEGALELVIDFDQVNHHAVEAMQRNRMTMVTEFSAEQRAASQEAIVSGMRQGLNPVEVARDFRGSIGLTQRQQQAVSNYRRLLQSGNNSEALQRQLRDKRFDPTLRSKTPLSNAQIERMVERYRERSLAWRAKVIARTEAMRAANEGSHTMYLQAVENGALKEEDLERKWDSSRDGRVRPSHSFMHGQKRKLQELFLSGNGNLLLYPGDPSAPADDTILCRCAIATRFKKALARAA